MSAHTPGPWAVGSKYTVGPISDDFDQSFGMVTPISDVFGDNRDADARLIAASPDLLEALQGFIDGAEAMGWNTDKARAAIAKATGGEV